MYAHNNIHKFACNSLKNPYFGKDYMGQTVAQGERELAAEIQMQSLGVDFKNHMKTKRSPRNCDQLQVGQEY